MYFILWILQIWLQIKFQNIKKYKVVVTIGGKIVCFQIRITLFVSFKQRENNQISCVFMLFCKWFK